MSSAKIRQSNVASPSGPFTQSVVQYGCEYFSYSIHQSNSTVIFRLLLSPDLEIGEITPWAQTSR